MLKFKVGDIIVNPLFPRDSIYAISKIKEDRYCLGGSVFLMFEDEHLFILHKQSLWNKEIKELLEEP